MPRSRHGDNQVEGSAEDMIKLRTTLKYLTLLVTLSVCSLQATSAADEQQTLLPSLQADHIQSLQVVGGMVGTKHSPQYGNSDITGKSVINKFAMWIHTAAPTGIQPEYGKHGYPMVIRIMMDDGSELSVEPAYECVSTTYEDGRVHKTCNSVPDEVAISSSAFDPNTNAVRVRSPEIYDWLQEGWKQEQ